MRNVHIWCAVFLAGIAGKAAGQVSSAAPAPAAAAIGAQQAALHLRPGDSVVVRIPPAAFPKASGYRNWEAYLGVSDSLMTINRRSDWAGIGFASLVPIRIEEVKVDARKGALEVRLVRPHGSDRFQRDHLLFSVPLADTSFIMPRLFALPVDSGEVRAESYAAVGRHVFGGAADSIPLQVKDRILGLVDTLLQGDSVRMRAFGGRSYLLLDVPAGTPQRESEALLDSQAKQLTGALLDVAFPFITELAGKADSLPDSFGFGVTFGIYSGSLISGLIVGTSNQQREEATIFVPAQAVARFAHGELTGQALVDASIIIEKKRGVVTVKLTK